MELKVAIIDDQQSDIMRIKQEVLKSYEPIFNVQIDSFTDPLNSSIRNNKYKLYLLDIIMPHKTGLELINELPEEAIVIFISSRDDLVFETFKTRSIYFVRKNNLEQDLKDALNKCREILREKCRTYCLMIEGEIIQLSYDDIQVIEVQRNTLTIKSKTNEYQIRKTLKDIKAELKSEYLIQIHASFMVNVKVINKIKDNQVYIGNKVYSISMPYRKEIKEKYKTYLMDGSL